MEKERQIYNINQTEKNKSISLTIFSIALTYFHILGYKCLQDNLLRKLHRDANICTCTHTNKRLGMNSKLPMICSSIVSEYGKISDLFYSNRVAKSTTFRSHLAI
nr:hypothetical protein CFP56_29626 [Quercus suber]